MWLPSPSEPVSVLPESGTVCPFKYKDSASTPNGPEHHQQSYDKTKKPHLIPLFAGDLHGLVVVDFAGAKLNSVKFCWVFKTKNRNNIDDQTKTIIEDR